MTITPGSTSRARRIGCAASVALSILAALVLGTVAGCSKKSNPTEPANPAPFAVTDLAVAAGSDSSVTLAWTAPRNPAGITDALRYDLRYVTLGSEGADRGLWTRAVPPSAHAPYGGHEAHVVTNLRAGTAYVFSLTASLDGSLWSAPSNPAVGTAAPQPDRTPPAGVTDLVQFAGTDTTLTVAWSMAGDDTIYGRASSYEVKVHDAPLDGANWQSAITAPGPTIPHPNPAKLKLTVRGLVAGRTYYIALKAIDDAGNASRISNVVLATTRTMRTYYIKADGSGDYADIQSAVQAARAGDLVLVAPGRYTWSSQGTGDPAFAMILVLRDQTDFTIRGEAGAETTILDAEQQSSVLYMMGGSFGGGDYAGLTIDGFTFVNGKADGMPSQPGESWAGGGLCLHVSDTVVRNCIFRNNYAIQGGGICANGTGGVAIENCLIEDNSAQIGGGILLLGSQPTMTVRDCVIRNNHAIAIDDSTGVGGGMAVGYVNAVLERNQIYENAADRLGGGLSFGTLNPDCVVRSCTVVRNQAPVGSAVRLNTLATLRLENGLFAFNRAGAGFSVEPGGAGIAMGCSLVFGNQGGDQMPAPLIDLGGNLNVDPLLGADGLHPGPGSPCLPEHNPEGGGCGLIGALAGYLACQQDVF